MAPDGEDLLELRGERGRLVPVGRPHHVDALCGQEAVTLAVLVEGLGSPVDRAAIELEGEVGLRPEEVDLVRADPSVDPWLGQAVRLAYLEHETLSAAAGEGLHVPVG